MRFLHISDLHIGKKVNEFSMIEDQEYILTKIINIIDDNKVDSVLIAGDVYDKPVPSAEAVQLLDDFITRLAIRKISVFIISGNHDSAERISFGSRLMSKTGIYFSQVYDGETDPIKLNDEYGTINIMMLPFIKPAYVKHAFPDEEVNTYNDAVKVAIKHMSVNTDERNILIAHQFVTGAARCESEDVSVGGIDNVDAAAFDAFDYVALGHIHSPQKIGRDTVRYCGTPLKYSFSEANQEKKALIIDMKEKGNIEIDEIPLIPKRDMKEIKGTYMQITSKNFYSDLNTDDYYRITLTDEEDILDAIGKLRSIYPNIMRLDFDNKRTRTNNDIIGASEVEQKSPLELLEEFYSLQNNQPMNDKQIEYSMKMIESIWEE